MEQACGRPPVPAGLTGAVPVSHVTMIVGESIALSSAAVDDVVGSAMERNLALLVGWALIQCSNGATTRRRRGKAAGIAVAIAAAIVVIVVEEEVGRTDDEAGAW